LRHQSPEPLVQKIAFEQFNGFLALLMQIKKLETSLGFHLEFRMVSLQTAVHNGAFNLPDDISNGNVPWAGFSAVIRGTATPNTRILIEFR
jgi:hypothetical protein